MIKTIYGHLKNIFKNKLTIFIFLIGVSLTLYMYWNPPIGNITIFKLFGIQTGLPGDLDFYWHRFILSALFLGLLPFLALRFLGYDYYHAGLVPTKKFLKEPFYWSLFALFAIVSVTSAFGDDVANFYPFSKTMVGLVLNESPLYFGAHVLGYTFLYYLPWEIMFRGMLIFPFLTSDMLNQGEHLEQNSRAFRIALLQVLPTALLHLPHPLIETLGAIPFGIAAAYMTLRYRSIVPVFILHAAMGAFVDMTIILRAAGLGV